MSKKTKILKKIKEFNKKTGDNKKTKKELRKLKKVGQSMRRELRENKERGDALSDNFVDEVLEQRRAIQEVAEGA